MVAWPFKITYSSCPQFVPETTDQTRNLWLWALFQSKFMRTELWTIVLFKVFHISRVAIASDFRGLMTLWLVAGQLLSKYLSDWRYVSVAMDCHTSSLTLQVALTFHPVIWVSWEDSTNYQATHKGCRRFLYCCYPIESLYFIDVKDLQQS